MKITKKLLIEDGWVMKKKGSNIYAEKKIKNTNPLNASEDSDISLVVHGMYNSNQFAIMMPDGGMLNFDVYSMEELYAFEKAIQFYDPPF